jgi:hypothetical protein
MSIAENCGWDLRGQPRYIRTPEGEEVYRKRRKLVASRDDNGNLVEIEKEVEEPIVHDQLPAVVERFSEWLKANPSQPWKNE